MLTAQPTRMGNYLAATGEKLAATHGLGHDPMVPVGSDNSCATQLVGPRSHTARHGMRPRQRSLRKRGRNHEKVPQRPPRYWAAAIDRAAVRR
jgi:hypothetical protein